MSLPPRTSVLPFVWNRDFVYGEPGECFNACAVMGCKYWTKFRPDLDLPLTLHDLKERCGQSYLSKNGLSLEALRRALQKKEISDLDGERIKIGIDAEIMTLMNIEDLYPFFANDPPFFLILSFDKSYSERGLTQDPHAVVLSSIDYTREKINIIDPIKRNLNGPYTYDLDVFNRGWDRCDNLAFILAPLDTLKLISGEKVQVFKQTKLRFE